MVWHWVWCPAAPLYILSPVWPFTNNLTHFLVCSFLLCLLLWFYYSPIPDCFKGQHLIFLSSVVRESRAEPCHCCSVGPRLSSLLSFLPPLVSVLTTLPTKGRTWCPCRSPTGETNSRLSWLHESWVWFEFLNLIYVVLDVQRVAWTVQRLLAAFTLITCVPIHGVVFYFPPPPHTPFFSTAWK